MKVDVVHGEAVRRVLTLSDAVVLAHALCAAIGRVERIRVLSIKGPVAEYHGIRPRQAYADADVIVEPEAFGRFCDALVIRGWHERVARSEPSFLGNHSRTFIHDDWPCDIDVHRYFPGFFADPGQSFDALWDSHVSIRVAAALLQAPSRAGAAVVAALHALRSPNSDKHRRELQRVEELLARAFSPSERREFSAIAERGGATWVLSDTLRRAGISHNLADLHSPQRDAWLQRQQFHGVSGVTWIQEFQRVSAGKKIRVLFRAVWVPRADIPRNDAGQLPAMPEALRYQLTRWLRGGRGLIAYLSMKRY